MLVHTPNNLSNYFGLRGARAEPVRDWVQEASVLVVVFFRPGEALPQGPGNNKGVLCRTADFVIDTGLSSPLCHDDECYCYRSAAATVPRRRSIIVAVLLPKLCRAAEALSWPICRRHRAAPPKYYVAGLRPLLCRAAEYHLSGLPPLLSCAAEYSCYWFAAITTQRRQFFYRVAAAPWLLFCPQQRRAPCLVFQCCFCLHRWIYLVISAAWPRSSAEYLDNYLMATERYILC